MTDVITGVYGKPPADVVETQPDAVQFSPLLPGAAALEQQNEASLASMTMLAPPGTLERRYAMALALRAIAPGGAFTVLAPKDRGGNRLRKELEAFGCTVEETARRHHRIAVAVRPATIAHIDEALANGAPRQIEELGLWSQPGVFSWDRIDPGTALLLQHLPPFSGRGADFGCGLGLLANAVLQSAKVTQLTLIDIDRRAVQCAQHNIADSRAQFRWTDARDADPDLSALDFVVMNAPFHDVIGNTKVRPRVASAEGKPVSFKRSQKMNFWMQVYNLGMDGKTHKPSATVEYDVVNVATNKPVIRSVENTDQMGNVGDQVTLQKTLSAANLDPGIYRIQIRVNDNISKQTVGPSATFSVE